MLPNVLTLLAFLGAAGTAAAGKLAFPDNLPDGHYVGDGTVDPKTGYARYTYLGPIDHEAVANYTARRSDAASSSVLGKRATVNCNGRNAGDSVSTVISGFASFWDNKQFSGKWAKTTAGSSQAYACNYGGTQTIHAGDFNPNMGSVNSVCGSGNAGWYEHPEWKLNYGRDQINSGIC
ncbi:hypothetical protein B0H63DRAFT_523877 [Podospora didyma]|uniref:Ecp2 effector protein domain-containing protein n=1 Tax=Podospora didyma TaxID=330526 RepID=A0AAE0TVN6_9PEZI|nr:hypothetical protein B0H63DRAFT_523877 [Podospora didyma]